MLRHMALKVVLHAELRPALVAHKRFDALVGAHVLLQQVLAQVGLQQEVLIYIGTYGIR